MEPQHIVLQWNWPKKNLHYYLLVDFFLMSSHTAVRTMTIASSPRAMVWTITPTIVGGNALDIMKLNTGSCTTQGTTGTCVSQCSIPLDAIDAVDTIDGVASVVQTNEQIWLVQHSCIRHDRVFSSYFLWWLDNFYLYSHMTQQIVFLQHQSSRVSSAGDTFILSIFILDWSPQKHYYYVY